MKPWDGTRHGADGRGGSAWHRWQRMRTLVTLLGIKEDLMLHESHHSLAIERCAYMLVSCYHRSNQVRTSIFARFTSCKPRFRLTLDRMVMRVQRRRAAAGGYSCNHGSILSAAEHIKFRECATTRKKQYKQAIKASHGHKPDNGEWSSMPSMPSHAARVCASRHKRITPAIRYNW